MLHLSCRYLKSKVILSSRLLWHDPPPFTLYPGLWEGTLLPWDSTTLNLDAGCCRHELLLLWVTVTAKWKVMNLMVPVTLGLNRHSQETESSGPVHDLKLWPNTSWPQREKSDHPLLKVPTHFLPRINHFPKCVTVWTSIPFRGKPHSHLSGCHLTLWPQPDNHATAQYWYLFQSLGDSFSSTITLLFQESFWHSRHLVYISWLNEKLNEYHLRRLHSALKFTPLFFQIVRERTKLYTQLGRSRTESGSPCYSDFLSRTTLYSEIPKLQPQGTLHTF